MTLQLVTIPCRKDNYAFLIHDAASGETAVVDVPDATPILAELARRGWQLSDILITHHHGDHIEGVQALRAATGAMVIGNAADAHRLPPLDLALSDGLTFTIGAEVGQMIEVPGHTIGHVAYHFAASGLAFTGDTLMAMGCGRLFEGSAQQMWQSLKRLAALPPETLICSGHEYAESNARFALTLEPATPALTLRLGQIAAARAQNLPTVPSTLADELATNPFLRAPLLGAALGMADATDAEIFAAIRARKDKF
ncbi:hydroxyacylglutathione hydrolase [Rhodobacter ferrooxidans]|uniref:Hydroxyacylglutathione hydrolase n=1 Tax=Rhodobacter ferrooxidans TaxID=371731 RepID=C8S338_9RHOB|nr:hydroxyacylglutathione hydrolase [Rhodobacter sp. SW2]EEW24678.1 hydroxyacylglutathione hydrolase [Rhodobacter sp. SW2]